MVAQGTKEFYVERDVLDEPCLDERARKRTQSNKPPLGQRLKDSMRCSVPRLKRTVLGCIPVLSWLPQYPIRENLMGDIVSGISVGIMHLPQGMAYALLASVPPVFGLYTSFYPVLVYFFFGTSRHISIGTFAVISVMVGSVTERMAPNSDFMNYNGTNGTAVLDTVMQNAYRVQVASSLSLLVGIFQILLGLVRFGFLATYLSEPLVRGYTTAAAIQVVLSQLKYIFGVEQPRFNGPLSQIYSLVNICSLLPQTNIGTLVVSLVALPFLILVKELNSCYRKKLPMPIPIELIAVVAATIISYYTKLKDQYHISVVGEIPSGMNAPVVPDLTLFPDLIGDAFAIAVVGYAIVISLGKTFGLKHGYKVDSNQELVALGVSNSVGGFFQCYAVTSSMSRSLVQESTGGKTQVAGVFSSVLILVIILKLGSLFEELPKAVLSVIVFVNLKGMFMQFGDIAVLWKKNKVDLMVWVVTLVCTILLNLDLGLLASIVFALLTVIFRSQMPRYSVLGHVPGTELYLDMDTYEEARKIPGITIFQCSTTVYYANAELYNEALEEKCGIDTEKLLTMKKQQEAKMKRKNEKEKRKTQKMAKKLNGLNGINGYQSSNTDQPDDIQAEKNRWKGMNEGEASPRTSHLGQGNGMTLSPMEINGQVNWAYNRDGIGSDSDSGTDDHGDAETNETSSTGREEDDGGEWRSRDTHTIILDFSTSSFADTVTVKTLKNIFRDLGEIGVDIYVSGCQVCVVEQLETAGLFSESLPKSLLFPTIHDAVLHSLRLRGGTALHNYENHECPLDMNCVTKM
ncbi:solute carrier family 26 member 6-like [Hypomesus transpacificus]|uniref:solute carrier family 26 member 6-like n=1 Tax=Hypomesus transpacificus TaxID=137520 RepID=UPI001F0727B9|nr:solute carrier family 26 member 6-like [Hypomesus transpacificus]